ncbi:MAG: hypothetical protein CBARDCOR_6941 [uncultured Caballeronia sp.]|nr:MAG: hypothetical protein CBARDCOR_6941 [uncultured Caballeronia sp.]
MLGSIITEPVSSGADFGLLFSHANGLFDGCGDSTFCAAAAVLETGRVPITEPITRFVIDTVNGPIHLEAYVKDSIVNEVRFENVPSYFVGSTTTHATGVGEVSIDIAFGGLYFGFVFAESMGLNLGKVCITCFSECGPFASCALRR